MNAESYPLKINPNPNAKRDELGRLLPGQPSLNPGGRVKGLDAYIREKIGKDGLDAAIAYVQSIMSMATAPPAVRLRAAEILIERCAGKAPQKVTFSNEEGEARVNVSAYSTEQLEAMRKILDAPAVIDAESKETP